MPSDVGITDAIAGLTERIHAYRFVRLIERGEVYVDRLTDKLARAAQVVPEQTKALEADADALIARGADFSKRRAQTFAQHNAVLDSGHKGLDVLDAQLALVSNSPLENSGGSSESGTVYPITESPPRQH